MEEYSNRRLFPPFSNDLNHHHWKAEGLKLDLAGRALPSLGRRQAQESWVTAPLEDGSPADGQERSRCEARLGQSGGKWLLAKGSDSRHAWDTRQGTQATFGLCTSRDIQGLHGSALVSSDTQHTSRAPLPDGTPSVTSSGRPRAAGWLPGAPGGRAATLSGEDCSCDFRTRARQTDSLHPTCFDMGGPDG